MMSDIRFEGREKVVCSSHQKNRVINQEGVTMDRKDACVNSSDPGMVREHRGAQEETPARVGPAEKAFRATTALVVFGIPLVAGAAALVGYGVQRLLKGLRGKGGS